MLKVKVNVNFQYHPCSISLDMGWTIKSFHTSGEENAQRMGDDQAEC